MRYLAPSRVGLIAAPTIRSNSVVAGPRSAAKTNSGLFLSALHGIGPMPLPAVGLGSPDVLPKPTSRDVYSSLCVRNPVGSFRSRCVQLYGSAAVVFTVMFRAGLPGVFLVIVWSPGVSKEIATFSPSKRRPSVVSHVVTLIRHSPNIQ